jgi:hypothetical protein
VAVVQNQLEKYDSIEYALNVKYEYPFGSSKVYVNVELPHGFGAYATNLARF